MPLNSEAENRTINDKNAESGSVLDLFDNTGPRFPPSKDVRGKEKRDAEFSTNASFVFLGFSTER